MYTTLYPLQQEQVLAELKEYARKEPRPHDYRKVEKTIDYLSALNLFFEHGLLGEKVRVFEPSGRTIQRMERGFQFFSQWMEEHISQGVYILTLETLAWIYNFIFFM